MTVSEHTQRVADHIAAARRAELPEGVVTKACAHILDTVAAMVSGSQLPAGVQGAAFAETQHPAGPSTVVGTQIRTRSMDAALAGGMAAHADETDDSHPASLSHPGCGIVPAALAVAEELGRGGDELVRAVVVGYDVGTRVVLALGRPPVLTAQSSYSTHAYAAQFGAAAAAAALHRLDERQARHALSYAAQSASGVTTWLRDGNHVEKAYVFGGMPAANGVRAAALVAAGGDGVDDVFAGHPNFLDAISPRADLARLSAGLGERYEVQHTNIKKFAVGSPAQAAVQAVLDLVGSDEPAAEDVEKIEIVLPGDLAQVVDRRLMPDINVQYLVAGSLLDGRFSFAMAHDDERMHAPDVVALMDKTTLVPDPDVSGVRTATVTLSMSDGRTLRRHVDAVRGTVDDPMSRQELVDKSLDLLAPVLGADRAREVIDVIERLPKLGQARKLGKLLTGPAR
ncbi:MmgE/PrpD family protein [Actinophytocola sp.]|uniref:MmgE/PrpD family protein n=1 Tax=Actinophytocola sp. TaxID=1872138 RepID=UPI0025C42DEC|nr:MmgE/PrpD family protein [Actinophytocola sp.]